jgi:hypothetical protein
MLSSGINAISTTDDNPVDLIANPKGEVCQEVNIVNEGTVKGFVSVDGGVTWLYMPAGTDSAPASRTVVMFLAARVKAKRVPGGSNMTGLYADMY